MEPRHWSRTANATPTVVRIGDQSSASTRSASGSVSESRIASTGNPVDQAGPSALQASRSVRARQRCRVSAAGRYVWQKLWPLIGSRPLTAGQTYFTSRAVFPAAAPVPVPSMIYSGPPRMITDDRAHSAGK